MAPETVRRAERHGWTWSYTQRGSAWLWRVINGNRMQWLSAPLDGGRLTAQRFFPAA